MPTAWRRFYALLSTVPRPRARRPRVRRHGLPARRRGGGVRRPGARRSGPAGHPRPGADTTWTAQPVPRPVRASPRGPVHDRRRPADPPLHRAASTRPASSAASRTRSTADRTGLAGHRETHARPGAPRGPAPVRPPGRASEGLRLLARVGRIDPTSLTAYLANGGYRALKEAIDPRPGPGDRRGRHGGGPGPRRRGVPRRPEVGGRRARPPASPSTSCATRTRRSPAPSRTARSSRRIRSRSSSR